MLELCTAAPQVKSFHCSQPTFPFLLLQLRAGHTGFHGAIFLRRAGSGIRVFNGDRRPWGLQVLRDVIGFLFRLCWIRRRRGGLRFRGDPAQLHQCWARTLRLMAVVLRMFPIRISLAQSEIARNRDLWATDRARFGSNVRICWEIWRADFLYSLIGVHAAVTLFLYAMWKCVVWHLTGGLYSAGSTRITPVIYLRYVRVHAHILVVDLPSFAERRQESTGLHSVSSHFWARRHVHVAVGVKAVRSAGTN